MKRLFLSVGLVVLCVGLAHATITRVQSASGNTGSVTNTASFTMTLGSTPTVGNWIIGCVGVGSGTRGFEISIGGATVGSYTSRKFPGVFNATSVNYAFNFAFPVTASANTVVTVITVSGNVAMAGVVAEYSADRGIFPDIWKSATGSTSSVTTGTSGTTNFPNELLVGCMEQRGQFSSEQTAWLTSITGSFGSVLQTSTIVNTSNADVSVALVDQTVTSTGTYTAAGTGATQQYAAVLNTFWEPTATPTSTPTSTPTNTPTPTPTATATPSFTPCAPTATPTSTATPTNTPTPTSTPTPTVTPTPCGGGSYPFGS